MSGIKHRTWQSWEGPLVSSGYSNQRHQISTAVTQCMFMVSTKSLDAS